MLNLPANAIARLPYPRSTDSHGQKMLLALSGDKKVHNNNTERSNHHPSISTLSSKGLSRSKIKSLAIYIQIYM